tara:strand:+ start:2740 stop:3354 length:615 start_codon:yes stop_codon:yes gene_type:complete
MGYKSFSTSKLKNAKKMKAVRERANRRLVNGSYESNLNSVSFKLNNAEQILRRKGVAVQSHNYEVQGMIDMIATSKGDTSQTEKIKQVATAYAVLESIGISAIPNQPRSRTFMNTDPLHLKDANSPVDIERVKKEKNELISTKKSFKDHKNPFYNLDANISKQELREIRNRKKMDEMVNPSNVAAAFFDLNMLISSVPTLGQFK